MTVSIGGVVLNDNLTLSGIENAKRIATSKFTHFAGTNTVQVMPMGDSMPLSLTTVSINGPTQGRFCQHQIDQIKSIEAGGVPVALTYRDLGMFNVLIVGTKFSQRNQRVPTSEPNKAYTGAITLEMV